MRFKDRAEAGQKLALKLKHFAGKNVVVFALPRGGVVLGSKIAEGLQAPLELVITRKIGHPYSPEYAICAITEDGELLCNESERSQVDDQWLQKEVQKELKEARRRRAVYTQGRKQLSPRGKTAIIVDDGVATALTIRAAIRDIKKRYPKKIVVAVPVVPADTASILKREANELIALQIPRVYLGAVGAYYDNFEQVEDSEVIDIISKY